MRMEREKIVYGSECPFEAAASRRIFNAWLFFPSDDSHLALSGTHMKPTMMDIRHGIVQIATNSLQLPVLLAVLLSFCSVAYAAPTTKIPGKSNKSRESGNRTYYHQHSVSFFCMFHIHPSVQKYCCIYERKKIVMRMMSSRRAMSKTMRSFIRTMAKRSLPRPFDGRNSANTSKGTTRPPIPNPTHNNRIMRIQ